MAGHRPWPLDASKLGAYDYDEITAAQARHPHSLRSKLDRRKLWGIECRIVPASKNSLIPTLGLDQWFVHRRYTSGTTRDLAFAMLVSKSERELKSRGWGRTEWRKVG